MILNIQTLIYSIFKKIICTCYVYTHQYVMVFVYGCVKFMVVPCVHPGCRTPRSHALLCQQKNHEVMHLSYHHKREKERGIFFIEVSPSSLSAVSPEDVCHWPAWNWVWTGLLLSPSPGRGVQGSVLRLTPWQPAYLLVLPLPYGPLPPSSLSAVRPEGVCPWPAWNWVWTGLIHYHAKMLVPVKGDIHGQRLTDMQDQVRVRAALSQDRAHPPQIFITLSAVPLRLQAAKKAGLAGLLIGLPVLVVQNVQLAPAQPEPPQLDVDVGVHCVQCTQFILFEHA